MQWYVYLVTISATAVLSWFVSELLSQPLRAFFELRRKVLAANIHCREPLVSKAEGACGQFAGDPRL